MKNKFYFEGKLVRTSSHDYKYACINVETRGVISCSETREGAAKVVQQTKFERARWYDNNMAAIKAIDDGRQFYNAKVGRSTERVKVQRTREEYEEEANALKKWLDWSITAFDVVELEKRA